MILPSMTFRHTPARSTSSASAANRWPRPRTHRPPVPAPADETPEAQMNDAQQVPPGVDPSTPSPARMYDCYLGGSANFQADRDAVDRIIELVPEIRDAAWANRGFLQRAVRWMAERGIRQFVDLGAGLPTQRCTHEVVREIQPGARVLYTDNDPGVIAHGHQILAGVPGAA